MSSRAHFWLRIAGVAAIVLAELLPRIARESSAKTPMDAAPVATGAIAGR